MRRPRRPVLAAVCAMLLPATAALWVYSYVPQPQYPNDHLHYFRGTETSGLYVRLFLSPGALQLTRVRGPRFVTVTTMFPELGPDPTLIDRWSERAHPNSAGLHFSHRSPGQFTLAFAFWPLAIPLALGTWWFGRGVRGKGAGFPVEPVKGDA